MWKVPFPFPKMPGELLYQNVVYGVLVGLKMVTKTPAQFLILVYLPWCRGDALGKRNAENTLLYESKCSDMIVIKKQ